MGCYHYFLQEEGVTTATPSEKLAELLSFPNVENNFPTQAQKYRP